MSVHTYLVTSSFDQRMDMWARTMFANWLEGRGPEDRETWLVTCVGEHSQAFVAAARATGVTLEEIEGAGDDERYLLIAGAPGTGWRPELATPDDEVSPDAAGPGPRPGGQLRVRCLLLIGDQAELVVEDGDPDDVVRHPAAEVAAQAGIPLAELPGKVLLVTIAGEDGGRPVLAGFRLAG